MMKFAMSVAALMASVSAMPASAGAFLVEVGTTLGSPNGSSGAVDSPRFRITNTTTGSMTEPYLQRLTLALDVTSKYTINDFTSFAGGGINGGTDDAPGVNTPAEGPLPSKVGTLTYGLSNFDPGAYSSFRVDFGTVSNPGLATDFRQVLFNGANTLTGTFSDGSIARVTFSGSTTANPASFSFNSTPVGVAAAVPEPATWAMMILGMGAVGYAMRRRIKVSEVNFTNKVRAIAAS
jgi:hypothetical protein